MTTKTMHDFIFHRIAETEHQVKDGAQGTVTSYYGWHTVDCGTGLGYWANDACECRYVDRVLAQCAAYKGIVEDLIEYEYEYRMAPSDFAAGRRHVAMLAATRVASIWADHPDYRPEWKP